MERKSYIITRKTAALIPKWGPFGDLFTRVVEGMDSFMVKMSPIQIIEASTEYYGHSLKGATKATKKALGPIDMPPVKICGKLGLYWFPSQSPNSHKCIWFALDHIKDALPRTPAKTDIVLERGDIITIHSRVERFKLKMHRARELKMMMEKRTDEQFLYSYISQQDTLIIGEKHPIYHFKQSDQESKIKRYPIEPTQYIKNR